MSDTTQPKIRVVAIHLIYHTVGVPPALPGSEVELDELEAEPLLRRGAAVRVGDPLPHWILNKQTVNHLTAEEEARLRASVQAPVRPEQQPVPLSNPQASPFARFFANRQP